MSQIIYEANFISLNIYEHTLLKETEFFVSILNESTGKREILEASSDKKFFTKDREEAKSKLIEHCKNELKRAQEKLLRAEDNLQKVSYL